VLWCACFFAAAWQLLSVQRSLTAYYERFKAFLNPVNAQNLQLLLRIAASLHGCLAQQQQQQPAHAAPLGNTAAAAGSAAAGRIVGVNDLLFDLGLDNINMFELARWVRDNKMAFKVRRCCSAMNAHSVYKLWASLVACIRCSKCTVLCIT
jgi:aryl carrier-like protein